MVSLNWAEVLTADEVACQTLPALGSGALLDPINYESRAFSSSSALNPHTGYRGKEGGEEATLRNVATHF